MPLPGRHRGLSLSCRFHLPLLLVLLGASSASAQYEDEEEAKFARKLDGSSRVSLHAGWRYAPNGKFYDGYYSHPNNKGLERAGGSIGGPLVAGTFGYSPTEALEVGIDLFATYERMILTGQPGLNAITYGGLLGLRFQTQMEVAEGLIPFFGILVGPMITGAFFDEGLAVENFTTAIGGTVGATLRLTPKWGLTFEYRLLLGQGVAEDLGPYNAAGSWFSVGMTYSFPRKADRPFTGRF